MSGFRVWFLEPPAGVGNGSWIKDCLTFNVISKGQATGELKELPHRIEKGCNGAEEFVDEIIFCASFQYSTSSRTDISKTESVVRGNI